MMNLRDRVTKGLMDSRVEQPIIDIIKKDTGCLGVLTLLNMEKDIPKGKRVPLGYEAVGQFHSQDSCRP